jgi:hypothetical protein
MEPTKDLMFRQAMNGGMHLNWMIEKHPAQVEKMFQEGTLEQYLEQTYQAYLDRVVSLQKGESGMTEPEAESEAARMVLTPESEEMEPQPPLSPELRNKIKRQMLPS